MTRRTKPTGCYTIHGKPLSVNNAKASVVINGRPRQITTAKARAWKHSAKMDLFAQRGCTRTIFGPCDLSIRFFLPTAAGDVDNYVKNTLDALQDAGIIANDRQVQRIEATKDKDRDHPRTEITITER